MARRKKKRFGSPPSEHVNLAYANINKSIDHEGAAHHALSEGRCSAALEHGLRATDASRAAIEHANSSGNQTLISQARKAKQVSDDLMFKQFPKRCLKTSR